MSRKLSLWWSGGKWDDLFWRASQSGGRATVRGRKGARTFGQAGDIAATHPDGQALLSKVTIELKRGYSGKTFADLLDRPANSAQQQFEGFVEQASAAAKLAQTAGWLLITKRDKKDPAIFMPLELLEELQFGGSKLGKRRQWVKMQVKVRLDSGPETMLLFGTTLRTFFRLVEPKHFRHAS